VRERLKELQLRLTELSEYLTISRPTLYKFVEYYDTGQREMIKNPMVLKLFDFITKNKNLGKKEIVSYIADGKICSGEDKAFNFIVKADTAEHKVLNLIQTYVNGAYDENNCSNDLGKLILLINDININKELSEEEVTCVKNLIQKTNK